jgi:hypothetical protein
MKQGSQFSLFGFGSAGFSLRSCQPIPMHPIVIPSGAGRFFPSLRSCEASAYAVEESASSPLVAQASACAPFNAAAMYPLAENPTVEILSSWRTKV